jgi:hypothetical protein
MNGEAVSMLFAVYDFSGEVAERPRGFCLRSFDIAQNYTCLVLRRALTVRTPGRNNGA